MGIPGACEGEMTSGPRGEADLLANRDLADSDRKFRHAGFAARSPVRVGDAVSEQIANGLGSHPIDHKPDQFLQPRAFHGRRRSDWKVLAIPLRVGLHHPRHG